jgi:hypothetical protein
VPSETHSILMTVYATLRNQLSVKSRRELALKAIINRWCSHIYIQLLAGSRNDLSRLDAFVYEFKLTAESTVKDYDFLGVLMDASGKRDGILK